MAGLGGEPLVSFRWLLAEPDTPQSTGAGRNWKGRFGEANGDERTLAVELSTADSDVDPPFDDRSIKRTHSLVRTIR